MDRCNQWKSRRAGDGNNCCAEWELPQVHGCKKGQRKHNPQAMLADKSDSQHRTLAPMFGSMPKNLETMFRGRKTLNQSRAEPEDEEVPEMGNWTGSRAYHPSLMLQL